MAKIKKDDNVIIITGKDKGKTGKVLSVSGEKVKVAGLNMVVKHIKANRATGEAGKRETQEAALHISNVAVVNAKTQKADRVGYRVEDDKKVRIYKSTGEPVATAQ
jgi:large subunit ribosomal protein L24